MLFDDFLMILCTYEKAMRRHLASQAELPELLNECLITERPCMLRIIFELLLPEEKAKLGHRHVPDGLMWVEVHAS